MSTQLLDFKKGQGNPLQDHRTHCNADGFMCTCPINPINTTALKFSFLSVCG